MTPASTEVAKNQSDHIGPRPRLELDAIPTEVLSLILSSATAGDVTLRLRVSLVNRRLRAVSLSLNGGRSALDAASLVRVGCGRPGRELEAFSLLLSSSDRVNAARHVTLYHDAFQILHERGLVATLFRGLNSLDLCGADSLGAVESYILQAAKFLKRRVLDNSPPLCLLRFSTPCNFLAFALQFDSAFQLAQCALRVEIVPACRSPLSTTISTIICTASFRSIVEALGGPLTTLRALTFSRPISFSSASGVNKHKCALQAAHVLSNPNLTPNIDSLQELDQRTGALPHLPLLKSYYLTLSHTLDLTSSLFQFHPATSATLTTLHLNLRRLTNSRMKDWASEPLVASLQELINLQAFHFMCNGMGTHQARRILSALAPTLRVLVLGCFRSATDFRVKPQDAFYDNAGVREKWDLRADFLQLRSVEFRVGWRLCDGGIGIAELKESVRAQVLVPAGCVLIHF
ncbi:hypothetical protein BC830DRAFT_1229209 [Chytriomyces sp. MP71]|nr:hypothetical protein BC830DRAFT_1229209 [Chytriomyces sp. MP71]